MNPVTLGGKMSNPFTTTVPKLEVVTEKYRFIPTGEFINDVQSLGYSLVTRHAPRRGLGMHSMSFAHPDMPKVDGLDLRLLATNSHDGSAAFRLHLEVGVHLCANILVSAVPGLAAHSRIVHRGYAKDKVAAAIDAVRAQVESVISAVDVMQNTEPEPTQVFNFLREAEQLRDAKPFRLEMLQTCLHRGQEANTAWNIFNRVQESVIRGGYRVRKQTELGQVYSGPRAREITNVAERVKVNYKLWELAAATLL